MGNEIALIKKELGRGGALCKEFNRLRYNDQLDWRLEQAYALEIIQNSGSDQLRKCNPSSIGRSLIDLSVLGLSLSPAMKLAYLIPYENNCTASPSYMGLEQIAYRLGSVKHIEPGIVRKGDVFRRWSDDKGKHLYHEVNSDSGDVTHAYILATMADGKVIPEVMDMRELIACREAAKRKNKGKVPFTWAGDFKEEMYKKCVLRRAWKHWPKVMTPQAQMLAEAVDRMDPLDFEPDDGRTVNPTEFLSEWQINQLIETMTEAGVEERGHNAWLQGLAKQLGYQGIRVVKSDDFDTAVSVMKEGIVRWKQRQNQTSSPSEDSGSSQDGSTQPTQET